MTTTTRRGPIRVASGTTSRFARAVRYLAFGVVIALVALIGSKLADVSAQSTPVVFISEVHSAGNDNGTYKADWFEVTNPGTVAVDIAGWKMDDNSNASANAVPLRGITSIPAGESAVFFENSVIGVTDSSVIASFSTAWFGSATPPSGLLIGAYGGSGVGLSGSGDAVNLFDASGNRITGVNFGAATANATFDNAAGLGSPGLPLPLISTLSAAGVNGAFLSANRNETGSPGRRANPPVSTVDLSLYTRIGRFDLPEPTRTTPPVNSLLAQEVSAVTYNWDTDTLFVVGDGGTSVVQVSKTGQLIDSMTLAPGSSPQGTDFYDPEGLTYVGGGKFVMVEERDRQAVLFTYAPGTTLTRADAKTVKLGTFAPNIGIEGMSYDPQTGGFIAVKETSPQGIFQTGIDFDAGTATNGSATTENSINLFDPALANLLDFADVFALSNLPSVTGPASSNLLVLSQESGKIINVDRNGNIANALTIVTDPGNPLAVPAQQHEGLTMDRDGTLYVVSENGGGDIDHPQLWVYAPSSVPNQAPTALALNNQRNTIAEDVSTAVAIKVADIAITDDGLGTNNLSVTGADAAAFEANSTGLYIKAGTTLDFETKSSYSVIVEVDDPSVGAAPDASASFGLTVTDVVEQPPAAPSLVISEVAPWASGNSPSAADWFEVTNTGANAVTLTGWKMDDSSNAFATAVELNGVTSIAPGESVIFLETASPATTSASFLSTWFGASPPAGLQIGSYTGGGVGLSTGGDGVTLFDNGGVPRASVSFGASPSGPFPTFDNTAGLNNAVISQLSVVGVNGAFAAATDALEIGSPGNRGGPEGRLIVTEVAPWSSGNSPVGADWFEVTNTGVAPVDMTGWKMDDNSESPVAAVPLIGISSIAPGESVIFLETDTPATTKASFLSTWFGGNPPPGLQIGSYTGSGVGLSTGGDAVNLYNAGSVLKARVFFGASSAGPSFPSLDNAAGLNNAAVSQLSVVGVNGAFLATNDANEIGSPGTIVNPIVIPSVVISEVAPWSSGNTPYAADWIEVTNTGATPVDITGWKVDDNSNAFASAVALRGVTSIPAGKSVVFLEGLADGSTDASIIANFSTAWFGVSTPPAGFLIGLYGGPGVGLSTGGDAVNLFDALGSRITGVSFGLSTAGFTFDNKAGLGSTTLPLPTISTLSVAGINGAFLAADGVETGSPGTTVTPPVVPPAATPIPRTGWTLQFVDSAGPGYPGTFAFDGDGNTAWTTSWTPTVAPLPHEIQINLGAVYDISGFRHLPRQDGSEIGRIGQYQVYVSLDGVNWGNAVATGTLADSIAEQDVTFAPKPGQFIRLRVLTVLGGAPYTTLAEFNVLGTNPRPAPPVAPPIPRTAWTLKSVDSAGPGYPGPFAFDGDGNTAWTTSWTPTVAPLPHDIQINLGAVYDISGFRHLPRQDGSPIGRIGQYEFYVSVDGVNWGTAVTTGSLANIIAEQEVTFTPTPGQFIRLRVLTSLGGAPYTTLAELNVLGTNPRPAPVP